MEPSWAITYASILITLVVAMLIGSWAAKGPSVSDVENMIVDAIDEAIDSESTARVALRKEHRERLEKIERELTVAGVECPCTVGHFASHKDLYDLHLRLKVLEKHHKQSDEYQRSSSAMNAEDV